MCVLIDIQSSGNSVSFVASWAWLGILDLLHTSCMPLGMKYMCELDILPEFLPHMEDLISLCLQGSSTMSVHVKSQDYLPITKLFLII